MSLFLLEDGSSHILEEDGVSRLLLEDGSSIATASPSCSLPSRQLLVRPGHVVTPALADAHGPAGTLWFPGQRPSLSQAAAQSFVSSKPAFASTVVLVTAGSPTFPSVAATARRGANTAYHSVLAATPIPPAPPAALGRFRLGDTVCLDYQPGVTPPTAPVATITGSQGVVGRPTLSTRDGATFKLRQFLGSQYPADTYTVTVGSTSYSFQVVAGGDPAGRIVSTYASKTVNGWIVMAQLESGDLVLGMNPRLP